MLDKAVQDYITSIRAVGGVVNTAIVMADAGGAQDLVSLMQHGGHIELEKLISSRKDGLRQEEVF